MGGLPSVVFDSLKGSPDFYKWAFRGDALKNYGELNGKAALAGLGIGSLIAGSLVGGPVGFLTTAPGALKSSIVFGGAVKDLIDNRDLNSDLNKTERQVLSGEFGQVLTGLDAAGSFVGGMVGIPKALQNLSNIATRGSGKAAIGEIAKIVGPGIKDAVKLSGQIGNGARSVTSLMSLHEAEGSVPSSQMTAPTEIRPGREARAAQYMGMSAPSLTRLGPIK